MRILLLNQYYWPDVAATAQILTDLAEGLACRGHDVTVVCSRHSYTGNGEPLRRRDVRNRVKILRLPGFGGGKKAGFGRRILQFLSFHAFAAIKCALLETHDAVVTLTTPPMISILGRMLQFAKGSSHIHWCMDLYPDIQLAHGMIKRGGVVHRVLSRCTRASVHSADAVCVLGQHMRRRILAYHPLAERLHVVPVWADGRSVKPIERSENWFVRQQGLGGKFVVMYSGNIGAGSSFETLLKVICRLKDDEGLRFVFIGEGAQLGHLRRFAAERRLPNVVFLPYQDRKHLPYSLGAGDVHVVTVKPGLEGMKVPAKTYGIMAAARPIIYLGNAEGEVYDLVKGHDIGCAVEEGDVAGLLGAIKKLRNNASMRADMGCRARAVFEERYDSERVIERFERILRDVVT